MNESNSKLPDFESYYHHHLIIKSNAPSTWNPFAIAKVGRTVRVKTSTQGLSPTTFF
jgi:hypothetical protein